MNTEIQDVMGQNFALPYDIDEDELMGELDGMEDELASEFETGGGASYMQVGPRVLGHLLSRACAGLLQPAIPSLVLHSPGSCVRKWPGGWPLLLGAAAACLCGSQAASKTQPGLAAGLQFYVVKPAWLQEDLPSAPTGQPAAAEAEDDFGLPAVPQRT